MHVTGAEEQRPNQAKGAPVVNTIPCERCGFKDVVKGETCPNCGWDSPLADEERLIVEVPSNAGEAPDPDPKPAVFAGSLDQSRPDNDIKAERKAEADRAVERTPTAGMEGADAPAKDHDHGAEHPVERGARKINRGR